MNTVKTNIHNRFIIEKMDLNNNVVETITSYNVVLDRFWTTNKVGTSFMAGLALGSGSGTPSASDTGLFQNLKVYPLTGLTESWSPEDKVYAMTRSIYLNENELNGSTITELGISAIAASYDMCTHAMLTDMNGNPIQINKTDTDKIRIYATVYVQFIEQEGNLIVNTGKGIPIIAQWMTNGLPNSFLGCLSGYATSFPASDRLQGSIKRIVNPENNKDITFKYTCTKNLSVGSANGKGGIYGVHTGFVFFDFRDSWFTGSRIVDEPLGTGNGVTTGFNTKFDCITDVEVKINGEVTKDVIIEHRPIISDGYGKLNGACKFLDYNLKPIVPSCYVDSYTSNVTYPFSEDIVCENLLYPDVKMYAVRSNDTRYGSHDGVTWDDLGSSDNRPYDYRYIKYKKCINEPRMFEREKLDTLKHITFKTPPKTGDILTVSYTTRGIAKDSDHKGIVQIEIDIKISAGV